MDTGIKEFIIAVITYNKDRVTGGGCPIFIVENKEEAETMGLYVAKATLGMIHDVGNECYIVVRH